MKTKSMMIEVLNLKTNQKHYDEINGNFEINQGPKFGKPVFEAYPVAQYKITLMDANAIMNENK